MNQRTFQDVCVRMADEYRTRNILPPEVAAACAATVGAQILVLERLVRDRATGSEAVPQDLPSRIQAMLGEHPDVQALFQQTSQIVTGTMIGCRRHLTYEEAVAVFKLNVVILERPEFRTAAQQASPAFPAAFLAPGALPLSGLAAAWFWIMYQYHVTAVALGRTDTQFGCVPVPDEIAVCVREVIASLDAAA